MPETGSEAGADPDSAETATAVRSLDAAEASGDWGDRAVETLPGEETGNRPSHMAAPKRNFPDRQRDEAPARVVCCPPGAFSLGRYLTGSGWPPRPDLSACFCRQGCIGGFWQRT